jgi:ankyrin repeat protein
MTRTHVDIVRILIENGADVNIVGGKYGTALQAAAMLGRESIVRLLIDNGAEVNAVGDKYGLRNVLSLPQHNAAMSQLFAYSLRTALTLTPLTTL